MSYRKVLKWRRLAIVSLAMLTGCGNSRSSAGTSNHVDSTVASFDPASLDRLTGDPGPDSAAGPPPLPSVGVLPPMTSTPEKFMACSALDALTGGRLRHLASPPHGMTAYCGQAPPSAPDDPHWEADVVYFPPGSNPSNTAFQDLGTRGGVGIFVSFGQKAWSYSTTPTASSAPIALSGHAGQAVAGSPRTDDSMVKWTETVSGQAINWMLVEHTKPSAAYGDAQTLQAGPPAPSIDAHAAPPGA